MMQSGLCNFEYIYIKPNTAQYNVDRKLLSTYVLLSVNVHAIIWNRVREIIVFPWRRHLFQSTQYSTLIHVYIGVILIYNISNYIAIT